MREVFAKQIVSLAKAALLGERDELEVAHLDADAACYVRSNGLEPWIGRPATVVRRDARRFKPYGLRQYLAPLDTCRGKWESTYVFGWVVTSQH